MSGGKLLATTRPLYWETGCKCRGAGYSVNATRVFRKDGRCAVPEGERRPPPITRVELVPGPSCDRCGKAWIRLPVLEHSS